MSSEVSLSAATRQNLLSMQDTAALTGTTQNRLATGKKVSSALDNPVNFFTAQGLTNRSSDLGSLLDGISNGIQTIQAANQGLTSIQKLVDSAKSTANQALATQLATAGTAKNVLSVSSSTNVSVDFYVNGTATTVNVSSGESIDTVISNLNTVVSALGGGNAFAKDTAGTRIVLNATAAIEFKDSTDQAALGFSTTSTVTSNKYGSSNDVTATGTDLTITGVAERKKLSDQYNSLLTQIDQLARDSNYNGVNLLSSNSPTNKLHIAFNEKDTSNIDVQAVDATSIGLNLTAITGNSGATADGKGSFLLDNDVKSTLTRLTNASSELRSDASTFGSKLSIVQNRQDFTKHIINVLGDGASKLTDADLNEEAANSQALGVRQQLGISALSLASQAQQAILQLLR